MRGMRNRIAYLFSFGPIKTATALGGAVVRVLDAALRTRMVELHQFYPVQSRWTYLQRLAKYTILHALSRPRAYGLAVRALQRLGIDYDQALVKAAHSFGAKEFFAQIRRQPSVPLVRLLGRRINMFERRGQHDCGAGRSAATSYRARCRPEWWSGSGTRHTRSGCCQCAWRIAKR